MYRPRPAARVPVHVPSTHVLPFSDRTRVALPLHALPLHASPLHTLPLHASPLHTLPLHTLPLSLTRTHCTSPTQFLQAFGLDNKKLFEDDIDVKMDEVRKQLMSAKVTDQLAALKRVVAMMCRGKDVSDLFPDVVKNIISKNIEIKKLVCASLLFHHFFHPIILYFLFFSFLFFSFHSFHFLSFFLLFFSLSLSFPFFPFLSFPFYFSLLIIRLFHICDLSYMLLDCFHHHSHISLVVDTKCTTTDVCFAKHG